MVCGAEQSPIRSLCNHTNLIFFWNYGACAIGFCVIQMADCSKYGEQFCPELELRWASILYIPNSPPFQVSTCLVLFLSFVLDPNLHSLLVPPYS